MARRAADLVLASASPSRGRLLESAGIPFRRYVSDVDEEALAAASPPADPAALALLLARAKAEAVAESLRAESPVDAAGGPAAVTLVLGCDSVLELDGVAHGKPGSPAAATARWRAQRGRTAHLITGHWLIDLSSGQAAGGAIATAVTFADATDAEIADYVASGEPIGVAGAFTLEGRAAPLIERIEGDPSNVIGLSLPGLRALLRELGWSLRDVREGAALADANPRNAPGGPSID